MKLVYTVGSLTKMFANKEISKQDKERQTLLKTFQFRNAMHVFNPWDMLFTITFISQNQEFNLLFNF